MPPPRPASGDTIYVIHAYGSVTNSMSMLACQYSQPQRPGDLDLLTLKVVSETRVMWATSVPNLHFLGLSVLDLGPMYATDRRQTASSLNAPRRAGRGHDNLLLQQSLEVFSGSALQIHEWSRRNGPVKQQSQSYNGQN